MEATVQRATQKINRKLLLSEPTKNKFPKSISLLLGGQGVVVVVEVEKGSSLDVNEHCSEKGTILFIGSNQKHTPGRCQPYVMNAKSSKAEAGHPTLGCPGGSGPWKSQPMLAELHGETWATTAEGERLSTGQEHPIWAQSC